VHKFSVFTFSQLSTDSVIFQYVTSFPLSVYSSYLVKVLPNVSIMFE
jgi:hypothetical protein